MCLKMPLLCHNEVCVCMDSRMVLIQMYFSSIQGVTQAEIKRKYRLLTKTKHPDKGGDPVEFMRIAKAYAA